jgi:two-component system NtrC family sensor kinase
MASRGGPGTLTLRTQLIAPARETSEGGTPGPQMLRVAVSDTGVGIPDRELNRIFDPFFTTKPVGQGTGLGLSICFGIVQEHNGRIWAESTVGVGTTVYVDLPVLSPEPEPDGTLPVDDTTAEEIDLAYTVLVVDDEEPVGALLARLLHDLGHQSRVVTSGEAALKALAKEQFDLILSDVKMPGMSGFDLYRVLQQRYPELAQRLVFITGDTLSPVTRTTIAQLGTPYLAKPFAIDRLEALVRSFQGQQSVQLGNE